MAKTKYQSGNVELVWRSSLKEHPLNPRKLSESAKKKLRNSVKEIGVMDMPVFNATTQHIVGGHQRLHTIDYLEKYKVDGEGRAINDYQVEVAVVYLDEEAELKAIVRLNNQNMQGSWDAELLSELSKVVTYEDMGFEQLDVEFLMEDAGIDWTESFATKDTSTATDTKLSLQEIRASRKNQQESLVKDLSADFWVTVVCKDYEEKMRLMRALSKPTGDQFISPAEIFALVEKQTSA